MTRYFFPMLAAAALTTAAGAHDQTAEAEDLRNLRATVENLQEANGTFRATIDNLRGEVERLRSEQTRLKAELSGTGKDSVTQDQLKKVVDQLREVDRKREADNRAVLEKFEELKKLVAAAAAAAAAPPPETIKPSPHRAPPKTKTPAVANPEPDAGTSAGAAKPPAETETPAVPKTSLPPEYDYVEHTVGNGETLGAIIAAYNKEKGLKIKLRNVLDANPKLRPEKLHSGQKIKIPLIK